VNRSAGIGSAAVAVVLAVLLAPLAAAREVPYLGGRVNDTADLIPADTEQRIEQKLAALEQATGAQMAVLTIASLEGEVLEEYSLRVAETWQLGRAEQDDGVLMLIARDDRKMRLEVGYGLEGDLTDAQAGRILNNILRPAFRAGDFGGGIEAGVDAVIGTLQGDDVIPPDPSPSPVNDITSAPLLSKIFFLAIFLLVVGSFSMMALFGPGCLGWFLWLFLTPFWWGFPSVIHPWVGAVCGLVWFVGCPIVKLILGKTESGKRFLKTYPTFTTFGTSGSSRGGWSGSSGGGFSGGFSGGGGSFGGGGASSSW
jgi:uncharacterized protein